MERSSNNNGVTLSPSRDTTSHHDHNAETKLVKFRACTVLGADNMEEIGDKNNTLQLSVKFFDANAQEEQKLPEDCPLTDVLEWDQNVLSGRCEGVFMYVDLLVPKSVSKAELDNFVNWTIYGTDENHGRLISKSDREEKESILLTTGSEAEKMCGAQTYRIRTKFVIEKAADEVQNENVTPLLAAIAALSGELELKVSAKANVSSSTSYATSFELPSKIDDVAVGLDLKIALNLEAIVKTIWTEMKVGEEFFFYFLMLVGGLRLHLDWADVSEVHAKLERTPARKFHFAYWFCQRAVTCALMHGHNDYFKDKNGRTLILDVVSCGAKLKDGRHVDKVLHAGIHGLRLGLTRAGRMKTEDVNGAVKAALAVFQSLEESGGIDVVMEADPNFKFYMEQVMKEKNEEKAVFSVVIMDNDGDMVPVTLPNKTYDQLKAGAAEELEVDEADIVKFKRSNGLVVKRQKHLDDVKKGEVLQVILNNSS